MHGIGIDHLRVVRICTFAPVMRPHTNGVDDLPKREDVRGKMEVVLMRLNDLCDLTQGEMK